MLPSNRLFWARVSFTHTQTHAHIHAFQARRPLHQHSSDAKASWHYFGIWCCRMHHFTVAVNHNSDFMQKGDTQLSKELFFFFSVNQESPVYPAVCSAATQENTVKHFLSLSEAHSARVSSTTPPFFMHFVSLHHLAGVRLGAITVCWAGGVSHAKPEKNSDGALHHEVLIWTAGNLTGKVLSFHSSGIMIMIIINFIWNEILWH